MNSQQLDPNAIRKELAEMAHNRALDAMEAEARMRLEDEVFRAVTTSPYPRLELAKVARWNQVGQDHIEQVAQRVLALRTGQDLESIEYSQICKAVEHLERTIADPGLREWKLTRLARRFNSTARQVMEAYNKTLCQKAVSRPLSVKEFREQNGQEAEWLVPGWIPQGTTVLLHADGGVGKTLFAYQLMQAVVQGLNWNGYETKQSPVLLVQVDEPALVTAERIDIRGFRDSDRLHILSSWSVERMTELESYIDEIGAEFVVIDSLTAINTSSMFSENDTEYARPLLQLANIASRKKVSFLIIHHSNADGRSRGSRAIHNSVSEVWGLSLNGESERSLRVEKTRMGRPPGTYNFSFSEDDYSFAYLGSDNESGDTSTQEGRIRLWLNDPEQSGKPLAPIEVSELLGIGKESTRRALRELWAKGLIRRRRSQTTSGYVYYSFASESLTSVTERSGDREAIGPRSPGPIAPPPAPAAEYSESDQAIGQNSVFEHGLKTQKAPIARSPVEFSAPDGHLEAIGDSDRTSDRGDRNSDRTAIATEFEADPDRSVDVTQGRITPENCTLDPGDVVEIIEIGPFLGLQVAVHYMARHGKVKLQNFSQVWERSSLKLLKRSEAANHADG